MDELASHELERAAAGTRGWRNAGAVKEIQARLDAVDASLTDDLRQQHPVSPLAQVKQDYPNRWVALLPTKVTDGLGVAAGRVFGEAADRATIRERIDSLRRAHPRLGLFAYFTGPATSGGASNHGAA